MAARRSNQHPLQIKTRPDFGTGDRTVRLVDLFAGCGGLSLGVAQAAYKRSIGLEIVLAVDNEDAAMDVYEANFPKATTSRIDIESLIGGEVGGDLTVVEQAIKEKVGQVHAVIGGPPCQGHSDLNNRTRRVDPKNTLYLKMARAAEVFCPQVVLIENVPSVTHSKPDVVTAARDALVSLGYVVGDQVIAMERLGVPQRRKRHVLLAIAANLEVDPASTLSRLTKLKGSEHDLRWAIGDLADLSQETAFDQPPTASTTNRTRMEWMLANSAFDLPNELRPRCHQTDGHSYKSMYGRLRWDKPAQTITSGFTSIGQGRYMHPDQPRALTAHEAARLQSFPDYFDFSAVTKRTVLSTMIGNAVPPPLACSIFDELLEPLAGSG